jgi:hypothetical protein
VSSGGPDGAAKIFWQCAPSAGRPKHGPDGAIHKKFFQKISSFLVVRTVSSCGPDGAAKNFGSVHRPQVVSSMVRTVQQKNL